MAFGFIDFAKEVLESSDSPLSVEEMWEEGCKQGLDERLASSGKTPVRTLSARIYVDLKIVQSRYLHRSVKGQRNFI